MSEGRPFSAARDGLRLAVRLTPKAASDRVAGVVGDGHGGWALKAAVTAPPVDGKANAALLHLLAEHFGLRPGDLAVIGGASSRTKTIAVKGNPALLAAAIEKRLQA
jgi:uncharacterized protein